MADTWYIVKVRFVPKMGKSLSAKHSASIQLDRNIASLEMADGLLDFLCLATVDGDKVTLYGLTASVTDYSGKIMQCVGVPTLDEVINVVKQEHAARIAHLAYEEEQNALAAK